MEEISPQLYFIKCNLLEIARILMKQSKINCQEMSFSKDELDLDCKRTNLIEHEWQWSWITRHNFKMKNYHWNRCEALELNERDDYQKKEAYLLSLLQYLDLKTEHYKTLKELFCLTNLPNVTGKGKSIPIFNTRLEEALVDCLINKSAETNLLFNLITSHHKEAGDISTFFTDLYCRALMKCIENLISCDSITRKKVCNDLYGLLLIMPDLNQSKYEEITEKLHTLCNKGLVNLLELFRVLACQDSLHLYHSLRQCENKVKIRHIDCNTLDLEIANNIFNIITTNNKVVLEELCLRTIANDIHWVEELSMIATQFLLAQNHETLCTTICIPALWLVAVLHTWKLYSSRKDILNITKPIIDKCQGFYPSLFGKLQETLERLKVVITWLIDEGVSSLPDINVMLSLTRNHSTLYVLQSSTHFEGLNFNHLLDLLLQLEGEDSWNIRLFYGFVILHTLFNIILNAVKIFNECENEKILSDTKCLNYSEEISKPILKLTTRLKKIEPLNFRLELLEDIFLLLFIRSEDFCEEINYHDTSPDDNEDRPVQLSRGISVDTSMEFNKPSSLPSLSDNKKSSPSHKISSSYPSSTTRKYSNLFKRDSKAVPVNQGFVCYPLLVGDLLNCIRICLQDFPSENDSYDSIRFNWLRDSVEEARWRLGILSNLNKTDDNAKCLGIYKEVKESWVYVGFDSSDSDSCIFSNQTSVQKMSRPKSAERRSRSSSTNNIGITSPSKSDKIKEQKNRRLFKTSSSLINLMLAYPQSLAAYFIGKDDIKTATTIIEKFNMQKSPIDVELNFYQEFSSLRKNVNVQVKEDTRISTTKDAPLHVISEKLSSGVITINLTKLIETFFAITRLPNDICDSKSIVVLDLALTLSASMQHSSSLLNLAMNYLNCETSDEVSDALKMLTTSMEKITKETQNLDNLSDILLNPCYNLKNEKSLREISSFWLSLEDYLGRFQTALTTGDDNLSDASYISLTACIVTGQAIIQNYQEDTKQHFLNQLRSYLTCLWRVTSHIIPTGTKYDILKYSLNNLIGKLIFPMGNDPMAIEEALQPLSINVVHLVAANCSPTTVIKPMVSMPPKIILNLIEEDSPCQPCNPKDVECWLSDLLVLMEVNSILSLNNNPNVMNVLNKTSHLKSLNIDDIPKGDTLFAFLINLHNLMWLHALIILEIPGGYGLTSSTVSLRSLSADSVCYIVGVDLFISLAELHSIIAPLPPPFISPNINPSLSLLSSNPKAIFVLASPYVLSPKIKVMPSCEIVCELDTRMAEFINSAVIIKDSIEISPILYRYIDYVTLSHSLESEFTMEKITSTSRQNIVDFLAQFFSLEDLFGKDIIIKKDIQIFESMHENGVKESDDWTTVNMRPDILKYLAARNPLLGLIIEKIHCIESGIESVKLPSSISCLERQLQSKEAVFLAELYECNVMLWSLKSSIDGDKLWIWIDKAIQQQQWSSILETLTFIPEKQLNNDSRFSKLRDWVLEQLTPSQDGWKYCQNIENPQKLCKLILANFDRWSVEGCITMFHILLSTDISNLPSGIEGIQLKRSMQVTNKDKEASSQYCTDDAWAVVDKLLKSDKINLALQWVHHRHLVHHQHSPNALNLIAQLVLELLEKGQETNAQELLKLLPMEEAVLICDNILGQAQSVSTLQQIVHFLQAQTLSGPQSLRYKHIDIGVHMLSFIPLHQLDLFRDLVSMPELIVEQLLMSTRISTLEMILKSLQRQISSLPRGHPLSPPCLNALFRHYAQKAVDVRVRTKIIPHRKTYTTEIPTKFRPPELPPTKEEWVGNDEVTDCMCCEVTIFSMFNRRHHCRRCGHVVCAQCSGHRLKVAGYGNVKVRICNDCFEYISPRTASLDIASNRTWSDKDSEPEWRLTNDLVYNATLRDEFTYTHAPSIPICLSILKLHSDHKSLLRFLLVTIDTMLQLLRPISPGTINPEVDYSLLITMVRSLLDFAKLSCSQHGSSSDWVAVDNLFAEVDLLGMLVASPQTCALLPPEPLRGQSAIATLRENLLKSELWTLALEVSTKAGLDCNSVWLAWGKACLKAGAWTDARDKFTHCSPHKKDTKLLVDIFEILQGNPQITDVKSRISRLKLLSSSSDDSHADQVLESRVYEECLYYLRTYGNHAITIKFFLNQNDIKSAVHLLLESAVDTQTFLDSLFVPALETARVTQLYDCMTDIDKSLVKFKEYLRASCAYCERQKLYHMLYQAQVWMNDHVRAAMSCIHFFKQRARTYQDLAYNKTYLEKALNHLQLALQPRKETKGSLVMCLAEEEVTQYMTSVHLQLEVLEYVMKHSPDMTSLTLFGSSTQRNNLSANILTMGNEIETSFILAAKVAQDWSRDKSSVLCLATSMLIKKDKVSNVLKLVALLGPEVDLCNKILIRAIKENPQQPKVDSIIALMDTETKITALILCGQLKSAYLLAVQHDRVDDIYRIMDAATEMNQPLIRKICLKRLNIPETN